jgi:hypothetical protein
MVSQPKYMAWHLNICAERVLFFTVVACLLLFGIVEQVLRFVCTKRERTLFEIVAKQPRLLGAEVQQEDTLYAIFLCIPNTSCCCLALQIYTFFFISQTILLFLFEISLITPRSRNMRSR